MNIIWGIILTILSSIGYFGQVISAFWPETAAKLGLTEAEADVDPTFYADMRGEAFWDTAILWTLPVAGVLLMLNNPLWAYFGLVGGGMYLYFAGRGIRGPQGDAAARYSDWVTRNLESGLYFSNPVGVGSSHHHCYGDCRLPFS